MVHVCEFEIFESEGRLLSFPFDFEGTTSGETMREAADKTIDRLKLEFEHRAMHGEELPEPTFGNEPRYGGRILLVTVDAGIHSVPWMPAAEAARTLGVSQSRASHMIRDGLLEAFKDGPRTWVTAYSADTRLRDRRGAGRPRRASEASARAEPQTLEE